ncbi:MAG: copper resistance protein NlpE [Dysgonomonas sp.]
MSKKTLFLSIALLLAGFSCKKSENKQLSEPQQAEQTSQRPDNHNSQNSLDYQGTYKGLLPTASGEGMNVCIELDSTNYVKEITYVDKKGSPFVKKGTYSWDESGNIITLNGEEQPNQYQVGENKLIQLDINGKKIEGNLADKYILTKD